MLCFVIAPGNKSLIVYCIVNKSFRRSVTTTGHAIAGYIQKCHNIFSIWLRVYQKSDHNGLFSVAFYLLWKINRSLKHLASCWKIESYHPASSRHTAVERATRTLKRDWHLKNVVGVSWAGLLTYPLWTYLASNKATLLPNQVTPFLH